MVHGEWMKLTSKLKGNGGITSAVNKIGDIVDFYLSKARDENAARAFLRKAMAVMGYLIK